ncbi:hypothetical protein P4O66_002110 [Electrophorus voltai]|uniref:Uncharacterized protein n=1 Tax=Electrophorus voltai TaxID=2609070 RepID=A0AAD8Z125_9TELE|nr:hypothetical protein P4O66_002110 [Electrophorus voltai]
MYHSTLHIGSMTLDYSNDYDSGFALNKSRSSPHMRPPPYRSPLQSQGSAKSLPTLTNAPGGSGLQCKTVTPPVSVAMPQATRYELVPGVRDAARLGPVPGVRDAARPGPVPGVRDAARPGPVPGVRDAAHPGPVPGIRDALPVLIRFLFLLWAEVAALLDFQPVPASGMEDVTQPVPPSGMEDVTRPDPGPVPSMGDAACLDPEPVPGLRDAVRAEPVLVPGIVDAASSVPVLGIVDAARPVTRSVPIATPPDPLQLPHPWTHHRR